jgi:hypothetical protein
MGHLIDSINRSRAQNLHFRLGNRTLSEPVGHARIRRTTMTTTEQTRAELLAALGESSRLRPEWRLDQTLANIAMTPGRLDAGGVWDLEDEEALVAIDVSRSQSVQTVAGASS